MIDTIIIEFNLSMLKMFWIPELSMDTRFLLFKRYFSKKLFFSKVFLNISFLFPQVEDMLNSCYKTC